ncbi:MAG: C39 family peptidase [Undibacterium sp.]|nr:C39 family peptidase [Undibacterium sp.]
MKKILTLLSMAGVLAMSSLATAQTNNLTVPLKVQEHSQWCWAGASQMVLNYFSKTPTQCAEANYALGINYACGNSTFNWNSNANQPQPTNAISTILNGWGVSSSVVGRLSQATSTSKINAKKPYVILWSWTNGGGHFVVIKGYTNNGSTLYINDPWPGNGAYVRTYASTASASDRYWYNTAVTN